MCIPNILGDIESNQLTGIVDWGFAGRFGREIDVASTVWSLGFNGFSEEVALALLEQCGWPRADTVEVTRLTAVWVAHAGPVDMDLILKNAGASDGLPSDVVISPS